MRTFARRTAKRRRRACAANFATTHSTGILDGARATKLEQDRTRYTAPWAGIHHALHAHHHLYVPPHSHDVAWGVGLLAGQLGIVGLSVVISWRRAGRHSSSTA